MLPAFIYYEGFFIKYREDWSKLLKMLYFSKYLFIFATMKNA